MAEINKNDPDQMEALRQRLDAEILPLIPEILRGDDCWFEAASSQKATRAVFELRGIEAKDVLLAFVKEVPKPYGERGDIDIVPNQLSINIRSGYVRILITNEENFEALIKHVTEIGPKLLELAVNKLFVDGTKDAHTADGLTALCQDVVKIDHTFAEEMRRGLSKALEAHAK